MARVEKVEPQTKSPASSILSFSRPDYLQKGLCNRLNTPLLHEMAKYCNDLSSVVFNGCVGMLLAKVLINVNTLGLPGAYPQVLPRSLDTLG